MLTINQLGQEFTKLANLMKKLFDDNNYFSPSDICLLSSLDSLAN